jgi:hypothetical protein
MLGATQAFTLLEVAELIWSIYLVQKEVARSFTLTISNHTALRKEMPEVFNGNF